MEAFVSCPSCGVAVNLDAVQPNPGKKCPVCRYPLNETALEEHTNQEAQNPSDKKDAARAAVRGQLAADVAGVQASHEAAKAAAASPASDPALASRVSSLETRVGNAEAAMAAIKPAVVTP
jgi:hypothetical protein